MAQISKILYIITQGELGGAQGYVFDLANNLSGPETLISVAAGEGSGLLEKFNNSQIATYQIKALKREIYPVNDLLAYFEIKKLIKQINPDLVHLNSSKAGVIGAFAAKHAGIKKIIYTAHGFVFNEPLPAWKKLLYLMAEKISARYKDKIICVSEFDKKTGIKNNVAPEKKFITIHNGVKKINFSDQATARQALGLPAEPFIIGTIANFYHTKGLNYLIDAAKPIIEQHPEVIFQLIGFGDLQASLQTQIKNLGLENKFFIQTKPEANKYLKAFDIFVLPSVKEGFPYTILEAMQAGLPIVATKVGGIPEAIKNQNNGILVESRDSEALAEEISNLIKNKNLADQLGAQAKVDFEREFTLDQMIKQTKQVYWS